MTENRLSRQAHSPNTLLEPLGCLMSRPLTPSASFEKDNDSPLPKSPIGQEAKAATERVTFVATFKLFIE